MPDAQSFTADELVTLRRFCVVCEDIKSCRFIRTIPTQKHTIKLENLPEGGCRLIAPDYDRDDFLAFLTHYRKLVAMNEKTNLLAVLKLVARYVPVEERSELKRIRKRLVSEAEKPPLQMAIGLPGSETTYTPAKIQDILFNGQVFHSDEALQGDLQNLLDFDPFTKASFLRYATTLINQAWQTAVVNYHGKTPPKHGAIWFVFYPFLMIEWYPNVLVVSHLIPTGVDTCSNVVEFYYPEDIALFEREYVKAQQAAYHETAVEDKEICQRMHDGRKGLFALGLNETGPYQHPLETGLAHFHQWYRKQMEPHLPHHERQ